MALEKSVKLYSRFRHEVSVGGSSSKDWVYCRYRNICCSRGCHCSIFECCSGNVSVCGLHLNPLGRFQRRKFSEGS
jgi:hypothetical protein